MAATAAAAQPAGGGGGGHRRGGGPSRGSGRTPAAAPKAVTPVNKLEIIGVIKAIDPAAGRVTIAYEAVEALNWPPGAQPFPVAKTALLKQATVGEKGRVSIDGGQVAVRKTY